MARYLSLIVLIILAVSCVPTEPEIVPVETVRPSATVTLVEATLPIATDVAATETVRPVVTVSPTEIVPKPFPLPSSTLPPTATRVPFEETIPPQVIRMTGTPWSAPLVSPVDSFWYLNGNKVMRYNLISGSSETVLETDAGEIETARLSLYGEQWLAFVDGEGLKLKSLGEGTIQLISQTISEWEVHSLVFSPDSRLLAYTDIIGLHILDLATLSDEVVWENEYVYRDGDSPNITIYKTDSWSADQEWLTVWIGKWEGGWIEVGSLMTGNHSPILGCSYTAWSPLETRLAMAVRYNGYLGCGGEIDGLYTVDPSPSGIEEQKIYAELLPESNFGKTGVGEVSWSPDGSQILYVQDDSELSEARLMLISANGMAVQILNTVEDGRILSPIWARDGAYIYFVEQLEVSTVYALEMATGEKRPIYTDQTQVALQSLSPDETWLVVANANQYESADVALVSLYSEMVIDIPTETMNGWIGWQSLE